MKQNINLLGIIALSFCLGIAAGNFAISNVPANYKVAVVDIQKIVASSNQIKALTKEQTANRDELAKFVKNASDTINKEKDENKKKALEEKYNKEFKSKQTNIVKNYETKLLAIDKNISGVIESKAKSGGYNLVLAKGAVLSGGTDITDEITTQIK